MKKYHYIISSAGISDIAHGDFEAENDIDAGDVIYKMFPDLNPDENLCRIFEYGNMKDEIMWMIDTDGEGYYFDHASDYKYDERS